MVRYFLNPRRVIFFCFVLSLFLHILPLALTSTMKLFEFERDEPTVIPVELVGPLDTLDTFQETAEEEPEDYKFASDRNLKTDKETSPDSAPHSLPQMGGQKSAPQQPKEKPQEKGVGDEKVFSLSKADLQKESLVDRNREGIDSSGFQKRLERGEQLKVNAREFDYGNYLLRMKRKLIQRWSPQKTISAAMYKYNEVRVDIGVVLNDKGEVIHLAFINKSLFNNYNREAMRAVRAASPFPNPPDSLIQDDGKIYMPWSFVLTLNQWGIQTVE